MAVPYYTYIIRGFLDLIEGLRVRYRRLDVDLSEGEGAAMTLRHGGEKRRIFVSTDDRTELNPAALDWADVYGKTNLDPNEPTHANLVAIGPAFGIQLWPLPRAYGEAVKMLAARINPEPKV